MAGGQHDTSRVSPAMNLASLGFALPVLGFALFAAPAAMAMMPATKPTTAPTALVHKVDVLGRDERTRVPARYRKTAESIGLLWQRGTGRACSAFCVGDTLIATNAHCVVRIDGRPVRNLHLFRFMLAPEGGVARRSHVSSLLFAANNQPKLSFYAGDRKGRESLGSMEHDWAFARLAKPLCRAKALRFVNETRDGRPHTTASAASSAPPTARSETHQDRLFMIAYHGDRALQDRWYSGDCKTQPAKRSGLLFHTCDTFKGSSGAPLMRLRNGEPEVVGINVGTYEFSRYRVTRMRTRTGRVRKKRSLLERSVVNVAVKPGTFLAGLQRFRRETLLASVADFRTVQERLREQGLYRGRIDGILGPLSRRAIIAYERSNGLAPLGVPTRELFERLEGRSGGSRTMAPRLNAQKRRTTGPS